MVITVAIQDRVAVFDPELYARLTACGDRVDAQDG
jgi:hypothetical protein